MNSVGAHRSGYQVGVRAGMAGSVDGHVALQGLHRKAGAAEGDRGGGGCRCCPHFLLFLEFLQARNALVMRIQPLVNGGELRKDIVKLGIDGRRIDDEAGHGW